VASDYDSVLAAHEERQIDLLVAVPRADGRPSQYRIAARIDGNVVTASESEPNRLPTFCPERHINFGGSFCLGWHGEISLAVSDETSARAWWARLLAFLRLQERARRSRRWPQDNVSWAHGDAAQHQQAAEGHAEILGPWFTQALRKRSLTVERRKSAAFAHGPVLVVRLEDEILYCVWESLGLPANAQQPCACTYGSNKGHPLFRHSKGHAKAAADLAAAILRWQEKEGDFWKLCGEQTCCGTLDACPLRREKATIAASLSANSGPPQLNKEA
jgi:hypothetical protein